MMLLNKSLSFVSSSAFLLLFIGFSPISAFSPIKSSKA